MDIHVVETGNGGDLIRVLKDIGLVYGFENMPYLAMFGGNIEASTPSKRLQSEQAFDWWGNSLLLPNNPSMQFNSLTERKLMQVPLTSSGRAEIEQAVKRDLDFMKPFASVKVVVSIIATDKLQIGITITQPNNLEQKEYKYIWDGLKGEIEGSEDYIPSPGLQFGFDYTLDFELA